MSACQLICSYYRVAKCPPLGQHICPPCPPFGIFVQNKELLPLCGALLYYIPFLGCRQYWIGWLLAGAWPAELCLCGCPGQGYFLLDRGKYLAKLEVRRPCTLEYKVVLLSAKKLPRSGEGWSGPGHSRGCGCVGCVFAGGRLLWYWRQPRNATFIVSMLF